MSDTEEKIKVMQAFEDGKEVEYCMRDEPDDIMPLVVPIWDWVDCDYWIKQEKQEPEYIPFTFEDAEFLIGKAVKSQSKQPFGIITAIDNGGVEISNTFYIFNVLLNDYTFLDGSPCGKVK